jgi:hypothetical protein
VIYGWREASKCTTASNQYENSNEKLSSQSLMGDEALSLSNTNSDQYFASLTAQNTNNLHDNAQNLLELNCESNLIFIASSHFGQRNVNKYGSKERAKNNNLFNLFNHKNASLNNINE